MDTRDIKRARDLDSTLSWAMWNRINTANSTITASDGTVMRYELERVRRWNIGLRKHAMELTGEIRVYSPDGSTYRVEDCWSDALLCAEGFRAEMGDR